jgi:hypothetical protein
MSLMILKHEQQNKHLREHFLKILLTFYSSIRNYALTLFKNHSHHNNFFASDMLRYQINFTEQMK